MSSSATRPDVRWSGGIEHWVDKGPDVRLFLWEKKRKPGTPHAGTVFFVHGSSMASQPTFDLSVPGRPHSSVMDWFCERGFDTWTLDNEGYGRSSKHRAINADIETGPRTWPPARPTCCARRATPSC
jgi:non-heme chloroperoxidase